MHITAIGDLAFRNTFQLQRTAENALRSLGTLFENKQPKECDFCWRTIWKWGSQLESSSAGNGKGTRASVLPNKYWNNMSLLLAQESWVSKELELRKELRGTPCIPYWHLLQLTPSVSLKEGLVQAISTCFFQALGFRFFANNNFKTRERRRLQNNITNEIFTKQHDVSGAHWLNPRYVTLLLTVLHTVIPHTGFLL